MEIIAGGSLNIKLLARFAAASMRVAREP